MEIEYELSSQDIINFNLYHHKTSKTGKNNLLKIKLRVPIIYIITGFLLLFITQFNSIGIISFIIFLLISILWFIFYPKIFLKSIRKNVKKMLSEDNNNGMVGKQKLVINENNFYEINEKSKNEHTGKFINKITENEKYYFLYLSSISAIIVPKNIFENNETKKIEFLNLLNNNFVK